MYFCICFVISLWNTPGKQLPIQIPLNSYCYAIVAIAKPALEMQYIDIDGMYFYAANVEIFKTLARSKNIFLFKRTDVKYNGDMVFNFIICSISSWL